MKEEHSTLVVQGKFSKGTASMYKNLRKEGSSFTPDQLGTIQIAANLTQNNRPNEAHRCRDACSSRSNFRSYRGRFNNFNRAFNSRFTQQDVPPPKIISDSII